MTLRQCEESREIDADRTGVVVSGVVRERLGDEDAGVVDERVDAPEGLERSTDDPIGGGRIADVSLDAEHQRILVRLGRAGDRHDGPPVPQVAGDDACADPPGTPGDDDDLVVLLAHAPSMCLPGIGSASAVRHPGAPKGSAKYCVSCATSSCTNSMMEIE
jgi:hypothetical protein